MKSTYITLLAAALLLSGIALGEDNLRAELQAKLETASKNLQAAKAALEKTADEKEKKKQNVIMQYEQSAAKELQARLAMAEKSDSELREEITPLQKAAEANESLASVESNPNQQKALNEKTAALKDQISRYYGELNTRLEERLNKKFGQNLANEPFEQAINAIGREGNARIILDSSVSKIRPPVTLNSKEMRLREVLSAATEGINADWIVDRGEITIYSAEEKFKRDIRQKLNRKVSFEFVDTPLDEAISFLRSLAGITMIVDPKVSAAGPPTINLRVTDMGLDLALEWILRLADLKYSVEHRAIYITTKNYVAVSRDLKSEVLAEVDKGGPDAAWKSEIIRRLSRNVSFEFVDTPLEEAVNFLNSLTKLNIILDPKAVANGANKTPITLRVNDIVMHEALYWICTLADLEFELRNQAVFITRREPVTVADNEVVPIPEPKGAAQSASKIRLKLNNGHELEADAEALKQIGALKDFIVNQMTDSASDGVLFFKLPADKHDVTLADWKSAISKVAPNVKAEFDEKLKLLIVTSDDVKALRKVSALMREVNAVKTEK